MAVSPCVSVRPSIFEYRMVAAWFADYHGIRSGIWNHDSSAEGQRMSPNPFLADLQARIDELEKKRKELVARAEKIRDDEKADVIARLKADVAVYGLTFNDLFGFDPLSTRTVHPRERFRPDSAATRSADQEVTPWIAYRDEKGNQWVGLGRRPKWVQRYVSSGGDLELLRVHPDLNRPD